MGARIIAIADGRIWWRCDDVKVRRKSLTFIAALRLDEFMVRP